MVMKEVMTKGMGTGFL